MQYMTKEQWDDKF